MKLVSCQSCGVVIDLEYKDIPDYINEDGSIIHEIAVYNGDKYVSSIECPVCKCRVAVE